MSGFPPPFPPMAARPDLPALEREILSRWRDQAIFQRSLDQSAGRPQWTFYEGPATANGMPGVHHVGPRTFKDLFPRFRTMRGYHVPRRGGWDCHGLPVEVAVEKELGLSGKKDIESYGIAEFNQRCRESVRRHVTAWEMMSARMGYWSDDEHAYRTMDRDYIESVWWSLKRIYDNGLLTEDFRISPYCPRCGTPLSAHEMGQPDVYQEVADPAVTVRFPVTELPPGRFGDDVARYLSRADLLVWTTTPWTLVANTAVAVHPGAWYAVARRSRDGATAVVADELFARVLGDGWHVAHRVRGADLTGIRYARPFELIDIPRAHLVVPGDFVTTEDGTGLVHLAPAFGADDMAVSRSHGLPVVNPVGPDGRFEADLPLVGGRYYKDADQPLITDLEDRGLLFRMTRHRHSYPHCWRCGTALLYYAVPSWYIRTTEIKDELLKQNDSTNWHPPAIRDGRYGEWLRNNVDWAVSRTRYWGTPLPLWRCPDKHVTCVGSLSELSELSGRDLHGLDPHRPFTDAVTFPCPQSRPGGERCGGLARRVPEVIDVWYDSGAMPFAQSGAPWRGEEEFRRGYPAQFICEGIDQTRGWFYSLMAVGTLVQGRSAYQNVLCLGLLVDEQGRKMSKHLGNVLEPVTLMDRYGADALRWFFAATGSPWTSRRLSESTLDEIVRTVLLTCWNTTSFLVRYANAALWSPEPGHPAPAPPVPDRPVLDRWLLGELNTLIGQVTADLDGFDAAAAGRRLAAFIDDLSNWYVRRSRRAFWDGSPAALATLHECLVTLTKLLAPFVPFLSEYLWNVLTAPVPGASPSVHLETWPEPDPGLTDPELSGQMALVRRITELGRSARAEAGIRTRQPLREVLVAAPGFAGLPDELTALIAAELNVMSVAPLTEAATIVDVTIKPAFRSLGRRFGAATPAVADAITSADPAFLAASVRDGGIAVLRAGDLDAEISAEDLVLTEAPREGWTVSSTAGETAALDTQLTDGLRSLGLAREVIRLVQRARKEAGLDITDRIELRWTSGAVPVRESLTSHAALVAGEVLATSLTEGTRPASTRPGDPASGPDAGAWAETGDQALRLRIWFRRSAA